MFLHRKNQVTVGDLTLTLEFFQEQEPEYSLPEGAIGMEYVPDSHCVVLYPGSASGVALPWPEGDTYLSKVEQYQQTLIEEVATAPTPPAAPKVPLWGQFKNELRGTAIFAKAYQASSAAPGAWSLLLGCLDSNSPPDDPGRLQDFTFAIEQLRLALGENDLTPAEVSTFNAKLAACDFDLVLS